MIFATGGSGSTGESQKGLAMLDIISGSWQPGPPMPTARYFHAAVFCRTHIFVLGGLYKSGNSMAGVASVDAYDLRINSWESKPPMPCARWSFVAVAWSGNIFVIGGLSHDGTIRTMTSARTEVFNTWKDAWESAPDVPTARRNGGGAQHSGMIYMLGGETANGTKTDACETFVVDGWRWKAGPKLPSLRSHFAVVSHGSKIFAIGGRSSEDNCHEGCDAFDVVTGIWETCTPMPTLRHSLAVAVCKDHIYAMGGFTQERRVRTVEVFDPSTGTWEVGPQMPLAVSALGAADWDDAVSDEKNASILARMWKDRECTDAVLVCEGRSFKVHRSVLSAASPVFAATFGGAMRESVEAKIQISDACASTVDSLLGHIYTGTLRVSAAIKVLPLAHRYQLTDLVRCCCGKIMYGIDADNVAEIVRVLTFLSAEDSLVHAALERVLSHVRQNDDLFRAAMRNVRPRIC
mmetsp:Transcript_98120/g.218876  ORF Transcript_98120/g.218876 Transcript_98120/m.218876 type:complete len:463 (+) Transcript_98120:85-1473(+)